MITSLYSPLNNLELATKRRQIVLKQMLDTKKISKQEYHTALNENLFINRKKENQSIAPFFIEHVKNILKKRFKEQDIYTQSLNIYTTLDINMQKIAENSISDWVAEQATQVKIKKSTVPVDSKVPQCAFIAIDPISGQISAMIGGRNFEKSEFNRATLAQSNLDRLSNL